MAADSSIIRPVILCGGAGTRLWPLSRQSLPKQFLRLAGDHSLLQQTIERLNGDRFAPAIIVSAEEQKELIERELANTRARTEVTLLEPVPRNTAAAAMLAAAWLEREGCDELMLLMPSDHVIADSGAFKQAIEMALPDAKNGAIVTFGAQPTEPNTQYGYIEADSGEPQAHVYKIAKFHEKPSAKQAEQYLKSGRFFWNCGIFLLRASTLREEMERYLASSAAAIRSSIAESLPVARFVTASLEHFARAENISLDHAIMEKTSRGMVVPVQMEWSDVGSWDAVWKLGEKDENGNVIRGDVLTFDSRNSLVRAEDQSKIVAIGVENLCIVAVDDKVLIAPMDRVAEIKNALANRHSGFS